MGCIGFAEEKNGVTLRHGITFNSLQEEIIENEERLTSEPWSVDNVSHFLHTDNCLYYTDASIAGYDNCSILYCFNSDDKLLSVLYCIYSDNRDTANTRYADLDEALSKYGTPICMEYDSYIEINGDLNAVDAMDEYSYKESWNDEEGYGEAELINMTQRLVETDEGYIDIQLVEFHANNYVYQWLDKAKGELWKTLHIEGNPIYISYTYCTKEQIEEYINISNEKKASKLDDL